MQSSAPNPDPGVARGRGIGHVLRVGGASHVAPRDRRDHARRPDAGDHLPRRPRRHARLPRADGGTRRIGSTMRLLRPARQRPQRAPAGRAFGLLDARAVPARARRARSRPRDRVALPRRRTVVGRHAGDAARARASARASQHHGVQLPREHAPVGRRGEPAARRPAARRPGHAAPARGRRDDGLARVQGGDARLLRAPRVPIPRSPSGPRSSRARSTRWTAIRRSTTR